VYLSNGIMWRESNVPVYLSRPDSPLAGCRCIRTIPSVNSYWAVGIVVYRVTVCSTSSSVLNCHVGWLGIVPGRYQSFECFV